VAKATMPQDATKKLFETVATRLARSIEAGVEPDLSYALGALSVLSSDQDAPAWDPFVSDPQGAQQLVLALCRAAADCGRYSRLIEISSGGYRRSSRDELPLLQQLNKEGDALVTVVNKAVTLLTIVANMGGGHARLAQGMARHRDAVMSLLTLLIPRHNPDPTIRLHALRAVKVLAPHLPDDYWLVNKAAEVYAAVLGMYGGQQPAEVLVATLQGLAALAARKDTGMIDTCRTTLAKLKTLQWFDADGFFHPDAEVRLWSLRALAALAQVREPPTDAMIAQAEVRFLVGVWARGVCNMEGERGAVGGEVVSNSRSNITG